MTITDDDDELETENAETDGKAKSLGDQEFCNWCDANEIDRAVEDMEEEDHKDFLKIKRRFAKAVDEKRVVVDGTTIKYTVSRFSKNAAGQVLTITRPTGRDFIAMDGHKETQQMQKFNAFLASIAGTEKSVIARLDIKDRQFIQDIGTLFLAG
jgi:hypothetical protein